jgi:putative DNA primase/helicase
MNPRSIESISRDIMEGAFNTSTSAALRGGPAEEGAEWSTPVPLSSGLPPVEEFNERLLPESFRPLVCDVADRMQVPLALPAAIAILTLSGAVGRRARIQPKAVDTSWIVTPNLWGGVVAPPSQLKSPVISAMIAPLVKIQEAWRQDYETAEALYLRKLEEHELLVSAWKEQFKSAAKSAARNDKKRPSLERPEVLPSRPELRRLTVNDATGEKLHEIMAATPSGILVIRDELTGWLAQLEKPGREGERAFALSAWNGDTGHTVDRISRGSIHVPHCCMSLLGGIQPSRLRSYLSDALADGPSNDGLIQRFQVIVWPNAFESKYVDRRPVQRYADAAYSVLARLVEMRSEDSSIFRFEPAAQELFQAWYVANAAKAKAPGEHPAIQAHLAKYPKLMPSLSLLFELADGGGDGVVSLQHAQQAAACCTVLESHARRVYSCVVSPEARASIDLAEKIKTRKIGGDGSFLLREVYLKGWAGLSTHELARMAAETLVDLGWLRKAKFETSPAGGRRPERYEVNPGVYL